MKRLFLLLVVIPFLGFAQNSLVKWYRSDLQPTLIESHITSTSITANGGVSVWNDTSEGSLSHYYTSGNWEKPNYGGGPSQINLNKYLQFTVSPKSGYKILLNKINFSASLQDGLMQIRYSTSADFSTYKVLQNEVYVSGGLKAYEYNFNNEVINTDKTLYVRIYIYKTEQVFKLRHNQIGTVAPIISGTVLLESPIKPVTNDDFGVALKNQSILTNVLVNDDYRFSGSLSAITATKPVHGSISMNGMENLTYTPDSNYVGYDSFYYTLTNSVGESNTSKVEIQVVDGDENVLVRWNKQNMTSTNYNPNFVGGDLRAVGENIEINHNEVLSGGRKAFMLSNLPNPQEFDKKLNPSKYLTLSLKASNVDHLSYLKTFKITYRSRGEGNLTIQYSKTSDFTGKVYTFVDDIAYSSQWVVKDFALPAGTYLLPSETLYVRIYNYNTDNSFLIDFVEGGEGGPAITGIASVIYAEPCSKTVTWNGAVWSEVPTIDKKAVLNGDYNTSINGNFSACNLEVNSGKLSIASKNSVTVTNEIKIAANAFLEVQNNANLIQINDTANPNTGNAVVLKDIQIRAKRTQYNYLGSPVAFEAGQNMKTIYPGLTSVLTYSESSNLFANSSGNVPVARGLALKEPTLAGVPDASTPTVTATFKGVPLNGEINYALAYSNNATTTAFGYNLLANPYPSNIDLKKLYELNKGSNMSPTIYLWDNAVNEDIAQTQQGSNYNGQAYAMFNAAAGKAGIGTYAAGYLNGQEIGKKIPTSIMSVGQGFLVRARAANSFFKFNNSVRTTANIESEFFGKEATEQEDRFWLKMITPANLKTNIAVVYFEGGSNDLGEEDSDIRTSSDYIFTIVEDKKLAINGRAAFSQSDKLLLGTQHFVTGNYTIALDKSEGVFANGQKIFLKDTQTAIITDLSAGNYTFVANAGMNTGRFEIVYQPEITLATDAAIKEEIVVYKDSGDFVVKASSKKITALELFDMSGRLVYQSKPNAVKVVINSAQLNNGLYVIKVTQGETVTAKKIIK